MMKEFSENPAFVEMMEAMRKMFSFDDMDSARASGHEHTARMNIVKERLRRKAAMSSAKVVPTVVPMAMPTPQNEMTNEFASILVKPKGNKKHDKK